MSPLPCRAFWLGLCLCSLLLAGCESLFAKDDTAAPSADGDSDAEIENTSDSDSESEEYHLKVYPQYAYQGQQFSDGKIVFDEVTLEHVRAQLASGDPSRQSWQIDYGPGIYFDLVRFNADDLEFYDLSGLVSAAARTGERVVEVRITYGSVTVRHLGRFYVLPPQ